MGAAGITSGATLRHTIQPGIRWACPTSNTCNVIAAHATHNQAQSPDRAVDGGRHAALTRSSHPMARLHWATNVYIVNKKSPFWPNKFPRGGGEFCVAAGCIRICRTMISRTREAALKISCRQVPPARAAWGTGEKSSSFKWLPMNFASITQLVMRIFEIPTHFTMAGGFSEKIGLKPWTERVAD